MSETRGAPTGRDGSRSSRKVANGLVTVGSVAVLAIYTAGYLRTRSAAEQFSVALAQRRPAIPFTPPAAAAVQTDTAHKGTRRSDPAPSVQAASPAASLSQPLQDPKRAPRVRATKLSSRPGSSKPLTPKPPAIDAAAAMSLGALSVEPIPAQVPATDALPAPETAAVPAPVPRGQYKDGAYTGWGTSRHGDIEAAVVVENGRVVSAEIAQCWTRYSCAWIAHLPPQVVTRQSAEVDYVSGATQSVNAFYYAVLEALSKAK